MKYVHFQFRFLILLLLIPSVFKIYHDVKIKNYNFLLSFFFLFAILFIQIGLNLYFEKTQLTKYSLFGSIFFLSIFTISYYYFQFINKNINFLIKFFIALFFLSCLYGIYEGKPDAPYFCGGIPYFSTNIEALIEKYGVGFSNGIKIDELRLSFSEFIFPENSHLGMIAPSILAYSIYKVTTQKYSIFYITSLLIFIFICIIKSSTTLFGGIIASLILIILFNYKTLNKKTLLSFFILIAFSFIILLSNKECKARFIPTTIYKDRIITFNNIKIDLNKFLTIKNETGRDTTTATLARGDPDKPFFGFIFHNYKKITHYNNSSAIYFNALMIAKK